ncbi:hypothetical protein ABW21_db0206725 [Orbilia brochopaga]|nr:hypothetical protein ABW21_db0206725 [Drechslerella brochopaga]
MARKADPEGKRTVGVITKCDRIEAGDERETLEIAANKTERLHHGWFVVRNRNTAETIQGITMEALRKLENDFFSQEPWNSLDRNKVGIDKLKTFLGHLLHARVQSELPGLARRIDDIILESEVQLKSLGDSRGDAIQQRYFLTSIAKDYENYVTNCLNSHIWKTVEKDSPLKIRTHIQYLNEDFAASMRARGHTRPFKKLALIGSDIDDDIGYSPMFREDLDAKIPEPKDIYAWISDIHRNSRGPELKPFINWVVMIDLFREQAKNWPIVAKDHINEVIKVIEGFNDELFVNVFNDDAVRRRIKLKLSRAKAASVAAAWALFEELVNDEFCKILLTVDEDYMNRLKLFQDERTQRSLGTMSEMVPYAEVLRLIESFMERNVNDQTEWLHGNLKAYYPIALKKFVANINMQVIERKLLGKGGPLHLFNPEYISQLTEEDLESITREDDQVAVKRKALRARLERAEAARTAINSI